MGESAFQLPAYARYAFERVRSLELEVWFEDGTRWIRLECLRDLAGNDAPFVVRVYAEGERLGDPWVELEGGAYPWWRGASAEAAIRSCLDGLSTRSPIRRGLAARERAEGGPAQGAVATGLPFPGGIDPAGTRGRTARRSEP
jgi:hypothetical protein